jgi:hypothetical protein
MNIAPTQAEVDAAKEAAKVETCTLLTIEAGDSGLGDSHILVRMPTPIEFRRWQQQSSDPDNRVNATDNLVNAVIIWPAREVFADMVRRRPGLMLTFAGEVIELAGLARRAQKKTL